MRIWNKDRRGPDRMVSGMAEVVSAMRETQLRCDSNTDELRREGYVTILSFFRPNIPEEWTICRAPCQFGTFLFIFHPFRQQA